MSRPKKSKDKKESNGLPAVKKKPPKDVKPIFATPAELAQKLRGIAFALTPLIVHLEGERCPLIADELSKVQKKLEENANYISEVSRLGQQKDLFSEKPENEKTIYTADCPKGDFYQQDFKPLPVDMICPNDGEKLIYAGPEEPQLAKTLFSKERPDKKALATGERAEAV